MDNILSTMDMVEWSNCLQPEAVQKRFRKRKFKMYMTHVRVIEEHEPMMPGYSGICWERYEALNKHGKVIGSITIAIR